MRLVRMNGIRLQGPSMSAPLRAMCVVFKLYHVERGKPCFRVTTGVPSEQASPSLPSPPTLSFSITTTTPPFYCAVRDYVGGLVDRKLEPDRRLSSEAERNWSEISTGQLRFDRRKEEAQALQNIREGDLLRFFDR